MNNIDKIRNKKGLLNVLNLFSLDLTIKDVISILEDNINSEKIIIDNKNINIINKYKGQYLKLKKNLDFQEKNTYDIVFIEDIHSINNTFKVKIKEAYSTSFVLTKKKYKYNSDNSIWTEDEFNNSEIITKEEFIKYRTAYNSIKKIINKLD